MPPSAVRVQGAQTRNYWALHKDAHDRRTDKENLPPYTPRIAEDSAGVVKMQGNDRSYYDGHTRYESYDGSGYGSPGSSRPSSQQYGKHSAPAVNGANHYDAFDFDATFPDPPRQQARMVNGNDNGHGNGNGIHTIEFDPEEQMTAHHMGLNTSVHAQNHDIVGRHLLYETALLDTQSYEILAITEVDELKKEHARLNSRIEAANRKLALESKVKDAAQNLQKLYSSGKRDGRPDTPQSPDSPRRDRNSLLGSNRHRAGTVTSQDAHLQAEDELTSATRKVDDLHSQIRELMDRRLTVERKLLRHTAAVLADQASRPQDVREDPHMNGHRGLHKDDASDYGPDEFDGIRDILKGAPPTSMANKEELNKLREEHDLELSRMQQRLEQLNSNLRGVITEASRTRGQAPEPEPEIKPPDTLQGSLDYFFILLENNVKIMRQEREETQAHYKQVQDSAYQTRNVVEEQLEAVNEQLHNVLQSSSGMEALKGLQRPPEVTGHGYQSQVEYLEQTLSTVGRLLREYSSQLQSAQESSRGISEAQEVAAKHGQKTAEYETVLAGLWDIVTADSKSRAADSARSPISPMREDFSLQAFSSRVQHLFDVSNSAKDQQDILRRQIQQQRDLNGKSDMEKYAQIEELQTRYDALNSSYDATQQELAKAMVDRDGYEQEATASRDELMKVMSELDQFRKTVDETQGRQKELDARQKQLSADKNDAEQRAAEVQQEMENLESEVVRLTTELTIAKAELEGAYGSRSERKKEGALQEKEMEALATLKDQEIAQLRREHAEKIKLLEQELQDMTNEFQEMTRESLELEKERGQLESLIDTLRERVEQLETQISDEKVKWMGVKPPGDQDPGTPRESTSVMVLRQEFKKMMRENRAEGVRLLRIEQEERRRLEAEVRKMRQAHSPLGRRPGHDSKGSLAHTRLASTASTMTTGTSLATSAFSPPPPPPPQSGLQG